jgi:hypothetical protein
MNRYGQIFKALNEANVQYIVVGGVAMNLHGYTRFTGDLDLLLALTPENLKRMAKLMEDMGYYQRIPVTLDELGDEKKILKLMKEKNLLAYSFIGKDPQFNIDVIIGESLDFKKYAKHVVKITAWDTVIPIVSADDLIDMKKKAGRKRDIEDVAALIELKGL